MNAEGHALYPGMAFYPDIKLLYLADPELYNVIIDFLKFYYGSEGTEIIAKDNQSIPVTKVICKDLIVPHVCKPFIELQVIVIAPLGSLWTAFCRICWIR